MKLKHIFFDLDGTLLPMDYHEFVEGYFKLLAAKLAAHGFEAKELIQNIWIGMDAMIHNNGKQTNESVFWKKFEEVYGNKAPEAAPLLEEFYGKDFQTASRFCGKNENAADTIRLCKELGLDIVLATNPVFPKIATATRVQWTGLSLDDFTYYTVYENSSFSKPNLMYYINIMETLGYHPEECAMIGNDVSEDMIAAKTGMRVFLLTDCLINKEQKDISIYPHGNFKALQKWIREQC